MSDHNARKNNQAAAILYDADSGNPIAKISLNGYTIRPGGPVHLSGAMRSFKLIDGTVNDLRDYWQRQALMGLHIFDRNLSVRVAAIPVDEEASGFVEFVVQQTS